MAEFAKEKDRKNDSMVVTVLESFDHLGTNYEAAMNKRYRGIVSPEAMILNADGKALDKKLTVIAEKVKALRGSDDFARSQLRSLVQGLLATGNRASAAAEGAFTSDKALHYFRNANKEDIGHLNDLFAEFGKDPVTLWLQLEELWDYAVS